MLQPFSAFKFASPYFQIHLLIMQISQILDSAIFSGGSAPNIRVSAILCFCQSGLEQLSSENSNYPCVNCLSIDQNLLKKNCSYHKFSNVKHFSRVSKEFIRK